MNFFTHPSWPVSTYSVVKNANNKWTLISACSLKNLQEKEQKIQPTPPYAFSYRMSVAAAVSIKACLQTISELKRATPCANKSNDLPILASPLLLRHLLSRCSSCVHRPRSLDALPLVLQIYLHLFRQLLHLPF